MNQDSYSSASTTLGILQHSNWWITEGSKRWVRWLTCNQIPWSVFMSMFYPFTRTMKSSEPTKIYIPVLHSLTLAGIESQGWLLGRVISLISFSHSAQKVILKRWKVLSKATSNIMMSLLLLPVSSIVAVLADSLKRNIPQEQTNNRWKNKAGHVQNLILIWSSC